MSTVFLSFALNTEDGWPPVATECLACEQLPSGYRVLSAPLFVKDLSVDDVIEVTETTDGLALAWRHVSRSQRSTIWLLRLAETSQLETVLGHLRDLGCNTSSAGTLGCHSVDVPREVDMAVVDRYLNELDSAAIAIAFPSFRRNE